MLNKQFRSIIERLNTFRDERDWDQFHHPKDLAEGLVIEAGEVLEHFLWKNNDELEEHFKNKENKAELAAELADTLHFILLLAEKLQIDLDEATKAKLVESGNKYPVEKSKGRAVKYTKLT